MSTEKLSETVLLSSDKAATRATVEAWLSRSGQLYLDERAARWDGATHVSCDGCKSPIPKDSWILCPSCREVRAWERWNAAPKVEWDGTTPIFADSGDKYFYDAESLADYCEWEDRKPEDLRLYLCEPNHGREVDGSHFEDELPEDGELPDAIIDAMRVFNEVIKNHGPLSWSAGSTAILTAGIWDTEEEAE